MDGGEVVQGEASGGVPQPPVGEGHGRVDHDGRHAQQLRHAGPGHGEGAGQGGGGAGGVEVHPGVRQDGEEGVAQPLVGGAAQQGDVQHRQPPGHRVSPKALNIYFLRT